MKPRDQFYRATARKDGLYPSCKPCQNATVADYERRHPETKRKSSTADAARNPEKVRVWKRRGSWNTQGIDVAGAEAALARHAGKCELCGRAYPAGKNWHVDHDHKTGQVRGVLCGPCNVGLSTVDRVGMARVEQYLNRNH